METTLQVVARCRRNGSAAENLRKWPWPKYNAERDSLKGLVERVAKTSRSKKPWQIDLMVTSPERPGLQHQRRFTISSSVANARVDAVKVAVTQAVAQGLEYVHTVSAYQGY